MLKVSLWEVNKINNFFYFYIFLKIKKWLKYPLKCLFDCWLEQIGYLPSGAKGSTNNQFWSLAIFLFFLFDRFESSVLILIILLVLYSWNWNWTDESLGWLGFSSDFIQFRLDFDSYQIVIRHFILCFIQSNTYHPLIVCISFIVVKSTTWTTAYASPHRRFATQRSEGQGTNYGLDGAFFVGIHSFMIVFFIFPPSSFMGIHWFRKQAERLVWRYR